MRAVLAEKLRTSRFWVVFCVCLLGAEGITLLVVAGFDLLLYGRLSPDDLMIGATAAAIVSIFILSGLLYGIRQWREIDAALRRSEERFRSVTEASSDWMWELDADDVFTYVSPKVKDILGYEPETILGRRPFDLMPPKEAERTRAEFTNHRLARTPFVRLEHVNIHRDGRPVFIETSGVPIFDERGDLRGYRGVARDISARKEAETERNRLEAKLRFTQKMEAMGTLAAGIAHEFNNALSGVTGTLALLRLDCPEEDRFKRYFELIEQSCLRMADLTHKLLAYSREGSFFPQEVSVNALVRDMLPILEPSIDPSVRLEIETGPEDLKINADTTQMHMVLTAIVANSAEAIAGEGRIRITVREEEIREAPQACRPELRPGRYASVTVADTGEGMDDNALSRLFDPFFSTKFQGRGLGLPAVYGIIQSHEGAVLVESQPGRGTNVRIYIPAL